MNRTELVLELFNPDENGVSRWVSKEELIGKYKTLYPTNGNQWYRNRGIAHLKFEKKIINGIIHWRFYGLTDKKETRPIRSDIKKIISTNVCSHTGFSGTKNNLIVVDHKNGRYNDSRVLSIETQTIEDFQPLTNQANLYKRTKCGDCVKTGIRFDAKELGYNVSVTKGNLNYEGSCVGCYFYDCLNFKKTISDVKK
jgi:hypothetical protein